jgi:homogentisate 1,2-dioxygenase
MLDRVAVGDIPRKHHIQLRGPDGALRFEHCITRDGFEGPYTIAYHAGRPHIGRQVDASHGFAAPVPAKAGPLRRRHYRTGEGKKGGAPIDVRQALLTNADVVISTLQPDREDPVYFSNSDGDDLLFCFEGGGVLRSMFGDLRFEKNDYVCVPRCTVHRFIPDAGVKQHWLNMECRGGVGIPKQWRNPVGQLRMDAPFSHRDFRRPEFAGPVDEGLREVVVKRGDAFTGYAHETSPLDVVGWDGTVYPWVFPILNFQPRAGQVHLPPTWHGNFAARGALICSFVPRVVDWHPEAIPCPYPHSSVEVDEFLFYCDGQFTSRKGVGPGSASYHPAGIAHGPHPGSYEGSIGSKTTTELAVMLDCYLPLQPTEAALAIEDGGYHESFR